MLADRYHDLYVLYWPDAISKAGFSTSVKLTFWDRLFSAVGSCPTTTLKLFSRIPGLSSLHAKCTPPLWQPEMLPEIAQCTPWVKYTPLRTLTHSRTHSGSEEAVYQLSQCFRFWTHFWNTSSLLASELWQKAGLFISETYPILNYLKRSYFPSLSSLLLFPLEALGLFTWRRMKTRFPLRISQTPCLFCLTSPQFGECAKLPPALGHLPTSSCPSGLTSQKASSGRHFLTLSIPYFSFKALFTPARALLVHCYCLDVCFPPEYTFYEGRTLICFIHCWILCTK